MKKCRVLNCPNLSIKQRTLCGTHKMRKQRTGDVQANVPVNFRFHGLSNNKSPAYRSWSAMKNRCLNPKADDFDYYGGRGIKICKRWLTFQNFFDDMGERELHLTLERRNVNGNYEKKNCYWATRLQQRHNRRDSK